MKIIIKLMIQEAQRFKLRKHFVISINTKDDKHSPFKLHTEYGYF